MMRSMKRLLLNIGIFLVNKTVFYIALSALLFSLSFFYPEKLSWLIFLFLIPLFYVAFDSQRKISFWHGFFWGVLFYTVHLYAFSMFFWHELQGIKAILIPIFIILFLSIYSGIWFFLGQKIVLFFKSRSILAMLCWAFCSYLYFTWMLHGSVWIFGVFMGYPFSYPLVPLANGSYCLQLLPIFSKDLLLGFLILFSGFVALFLRYFKKKYIFLSFFLLIPFLYGILFPLDTFFPKQIKNIGYISPSCVNKQHSLDAAQQIYYAMVQLIQKRPNVSLIVMPETSYLFDLNELKYIIDLWCHNILDDEIDLIIGAPRKEKENRYNSLYWIGQGDIKGTYDKVHLMAFTEFIPRFWDYVGIFKDFFLHYDGKYVKGKKKQAVFEINNIRFKPRICFDMLIGKRRGKNNGLATKKDVLLVAVNDTVFQSRHMRKLMFLFAKMRALQCCEDMLYVGYYRAIWVSKSGCEKCIS